ncbi:peptidoglycan-binding protein [Polyangium mundeleinium]|uniref:Serine protease n=1 Tax=Polyangium mundeleinium TaxID=2995306 RepID=A0ABT5EV19_9BACT|nr:peptidoglycan-binding protein [Polyangium mundeleinium]MDC0744747.1 peptidoglycan-binding protein [Polyangium mundeleinium]
MGRKTREDVGGTEARPALSAEAPFMLTLLDVGEQPYGDAVLCRFGDISIMIDGAHPANHRRKDGHLSIQEQIKPLLPQRGRASVVTLLIVSHAHQDHIGCLPRLVRDGHLVAEWALVAHPELGWGKVGRERAAPEVSPSALRIAAALREEPQEFDDAGEESAFLEAAQRMDDEYREMLNTLARKGTRVIPFLGSDDPAVRPLVEALARRGVSLKLLGPTRKHVAACAEGISGGLETMSVEIEKVLAAESTESPDEEADEAKEARELEVYRRFASRFASADEEAGGGEEAGIPRVSKFVNLQSSVLVFAYQGKKFLFTGDMQLADPQTTDPTVLAGMKKILGAIRKDAPYDFVKLSHHGSDNGISAELLELMGNPRLLGICAGEKSSRHPNARTIDLMKRTRAKRDLRWARTDKNGLTTIRFDKGEPAVNVSCGHINDASPPRGSRRSETADMDEADMDEADMDEADMDEVDMDEVDMEETESRARGKPVASGPCVGSAPEHGDETNVGFAGERGEETNVAPLEGVLEFVPGYRRAGGVAAELEHGLETGAAPSDPVLRPARPAKPTGEEATLAIEAAAEPETLFDPAYLAPITATESIVGGVDDRRLITPTTALPWRAICSLRMTSADGKRFIGTGCLINPRTVLTAGHCVYSHAFGGFMKSVEVTPALDSDARPFGSVVGKKFHAAEEWIKDKSSEYDYGVILLDEPIRLESGFFVPMPASNAELEGVLANIAGYPSDRELGRRLFFHARKLQNIGTRRVQYDIDTFGGQSGSPVWVTLPNGKRIVTAIHTNGTTPSVKFNSGTRITAEVLRNLTKWAAEAEAPNPRRRRAPRREEAPATESAGERPRERTATMLRGRVIDRVRRPIAGATVAISAGDAPYPEVAAISAEDGSFTLPITRSGRYGVEAFSAGGRGATTTTVAGDETSDATIMLDSEREDMTNETVAAPSKPPLRGMPLPGTGMKRCVKSEAVTQLQNALVRLGHMTKAQVNADRGTFGEQTEAALKKFQAKHGVPVTGTYGPKTRAAFAKLGAKVAKAPKPRRTTRGGV